MKRCASAIFLCLFLCISTASGEVLNEKLDSLFVIASSGEVDHRDQNEPAMDSIATYGELAVPFLVDKFATKSARERWTVIWTLQRIGAKAVPYLVQSLNRPEGLIVERVCTALGELKDSAAIDQLVWVFGHTRWQVRNEAVTALGKIGNKRGGETAIRALEDSIGEIRKSAAVALGAMQYGPAIDPLIAMLDDPFYGARLTAMESLTRLDTAKVLQALTTLLESDKTAKGDLACDLFAQLAHVNSLQVLADQLGATRPERRTHAALGILAADPDNLCGYHDLLLNSEFADTLTKVKIQSALASRANAGN